MIEAKTYRRKGHAEHDDQRYIPEGEDRVLGESTTIRSIASRSFCLTRRSRTREKLEEITADVMREIDEDSEWAESSPMPEPEGAVYGVFDNSIVPPAFPAEGAGELNDRFSELAYCAGLRSTGDLESAARDAASNAATQRLSFVLPSRRLRSYPSI